MSSRCPTLPFLPGYTFNANLGRTNYRRNNIFETYNGVRVLTDKPESIGAKINTRYPSIYARREVAELPSWIAFDRQVLTFEAYYQETLQEVRNSPFQVRACKIYFFLEDGTVKVIEPKVENSGIPQGTLIARQRISFPPPKDDQFYDIIDFNIGREIELFGKVFKITNCDKFTRNFLNRLGIAVPDPVLTPADPYIANRRKVAETVFGKKPSVKEIPTGKFLKFDRQVLRFYGYWDDRTLDGGNLHNLKILYYLADDTIEVLEEIEKNSGKDTGSTLIKRGRLPKFYSELPSPGYYDTSIVLNVLGPNFQYGRFINDPLGCGKNDVKYYNEHDLAIGATIDVYGKKVVLVDCDPFTKEYYKTKFGLDDFTPAPRPHIEKTIEAIPRHKRKLPPWNGFGSFEDSAQNCITAELKQVMKDVKKFLSLDRDGMDSRILRFSARMKSKIPEDRTRRFVICFFLCDDAISIIELADKHSGKVFLHREPVKLPGQDIFTSEPPDYYQPHHMFVGATLNINNFVFVLTDVDEYALRYMELHPEKFPKANIKIILEKVRKKLEPIYKDFVAEFLPKEQPVIPFEALRQKLCTIMGDDWTEHEMITLARHFSAVCRTERYTRTFIRQIVLTELKRHLWDDLDRLREYFRAWDPEHTGYLPKKEIYTLLKACKLPLDKEVLEHMLNVMEKNDKCEIAETDLFKFLDRTYCPVPDIVPLNLKTELWWASEREPVAGKLIDWCAFNKGLELEDKFKEPIVIKKK